LWLFFKITTTRRLRQGNNSLKLNQAQAISLFAVKVRKKKQKNIEGNQCLT
jgi:hypothetical protein